MSLQLKSSDSFRTRLITACRATNDSARHLFFSVKKRKVPNLRSQFHPPVSLPPSSPPRSSRPRRPPRSSLAIPRVKKRCVGRWHQSRDPAPITTPSRARPRSYLLAHASLPAARRSRRCPRPSGPAPFTSSFAPAQSSSLLPDPHPRPAPIRPAPSTSPFVPAPSTPERANSPTPSLPRRFTRRRHVGPLSQR